MNIKPLAAVVSLLAAGSVTAGEIYATDTNTVELSGWAKAVGAYVNSDFLDDKGADKDQKEHVYTDAHLSVKGTHFLSEDAKVIGSFAINTGNSATNKNAEFADIKLEFDHVTLGNLSLGDTGNSFGAVEKAKSGEGVNLFFVDQGGVDGQGIRYKKTVAEKLELSVNYETDSASDYDSNYALSANYKADSFSAAIAYNSDGSDGESIGLAGDIEFGDLKLAAAFISFEDGKKLKLNESNDFELSQPNDGQTYSLAATYTIDLFRIYGSVQFAEGDYVGSDFEAKTAYLGLGYDMTKEFKTDFVLQTGEYDEQGKSTQDVDAVKFVAKYSF